MHSVTVGCILMEIIAGPLLRAVPEGDWTRRTVWTRTILTERRWNGNVTHSVNRPLGCSFRGAIPQRSCGIACRPVVCCVDGELYLCDVGLFGGGAFIFGAVSLFFFGSSKQKMRHPILRWICLHASDIFTSLHTWRLTSRALLH